MSDPPREPVPPPPSPSPPPAETQKPAANPANANALTPEEQMALFEQELKETDWGHQPC
jgi:hypothetical protein